MNAIANQLQQQIGNRKSISVFTRSHEHTVMLFIKMIQNANDVQKAGEIAETLLAELIREANQNDSPFHGLFENIGFELVSDDDGGFYIRMNKPEEGERINDSDIFYSQLTPVRSSEIDHLSPALGQFSIMQAHSDSIGDNADQIQVNALRSATEHTPRPDYIWLFFNLTVPLLGEKIAGSLFPIIEAR